VGADGRQDEALPLDEADDLAGDEKVSIKDQTIEGHFKPA